MDTVGLLCGESDCETSSLGYNSGKMCIIYNKFLDCVLAKISSYYFNKQANNNLW